MEKRVLGAARLSSSLVDYLNMRGLKNLGNTCYFNVAVQCLAHAPPLAHHLMLNEYTGLCAITFEYQKVLKQLFIRETEEPVDPSDLLGAFRNRFTEFEERKQHDAQEVILKLMAVFEQSIGIRAFTGKDVNGPMTTHLVAVMEPAGLEDLVEVRDVVEWPLITSFTFVMYDHKFPVILPFEFNNKKLYAVVMHKGSSDEGHYALLVKVHGRWFLKEDANVYELPCQIETMRGDFYMAFYRPEKCIT